jgi:hypothetical protein
MPHQYLVVHFDRYDTSKSTHTFLLADSPVDAIWLSAPEECRDDPEVLDYFKDNIHHANAEFSCVAEEESDYLCFRMKG